MNGRDGNDAPPAVTGGPAGLLAVELSESIESDGYLHAVVVRWESWQRPAPSVEVPPGKRFLLSAVGGNGEDGRTGGDGRSGSIGTEGTPATREMDATVSLSIDGVIHHSTIRELTVCFEGWFRRR